MSNAAETGGKKVKTNYRVEFSVERRGGAVRKAFEGTNLDRLLARVEKADGYSVNVLTEVVS